MHSLGLQQLNVLIVILLLYYCYIIVSILAWVL